MTGASLDVDVFRDVPGYRGILKAVLKCQIQLLVEQLSEHTGEESVLLSANVTEGTLSHLGSDSGKGFLVEHTEVKRQYLGYCLKRHQKRKSEFMSPSGSRHDLQPVKLVRTGPEPYQNFNAHKKPAFRIQRRNSRIRSGGKQFSSVFSKGSSIRSAYLKPTGNNVLTGSSSGLTINQSSMHQNSNQYADQRSSESLNSEYDGQRSGEIDEDHSYSPEVVIKTEVMSDDNMDNEDEHVSSETAKEVIVKVERPDELDETGDNRTRVKSEDMRTFGDGLGQQYSPNVTMESEGGNQCDGNQSFEYVLDQENSTDMLTPWKPEDGDKNTSQNISKRKQSLPTRIAKSGEIREYARAGHQQFGTDNSAYSRMDEDVWSHDHKHDRSADNQPHDETSYGDILDDKSGLSKSSDMIWTEETFQTNSPGGLKTYMKTPQIDGLFVSRGEGRFEKLIKCDDCGKVCRTSNMSRHRKRYCTSVPKDIKFKNNFSPMSNMSGSRSAENVDNSVYIDNPEKEKEIRLDVTALDLIGHRQSNFTITPMSTRKVEFTGGSRSSLGSVPIKIEPYTTNDGAIGSNVGDNDGVDGKYVVTKLGLRRTNVGLNKTFDRSEISNAGLSKANDGSEKSNAGLNKIIDRSEISKTGLNKTNNGIDKTKTKFSLCKIISVGSSKTCAELNSNVETKATDLNLNKDHQYSNTITLEGENKTDSGDVSAINANNVDRDTNSTTAETENDESSPGLQETVPDESRHSETNISHFQPLFPDGSETDLMDDGEQSPDFQPDLVINQETPTSETEATDDRI